MLVVFIPCLGHAQFVPGPLRDDGDGQCVQPGLHQLRCYVNGTIPLSAALGGVAFTSASARGSRDGVTVGAGVTAMKSDRVRIGLQYDGERRETFQSHSGSFKPSFSFRSLTA